MTRRGPIRHLVLDTEAAYALLASTPVNPKRAAVVMAIVAANGQRVVLIAVRGEASDRTDPGAANANQLIRVDDGLDRMRGNRVVLLRAVVPGASVVDAAVALAAEPVGASAGVVEVLTSDVAGMRDLAAHVRARLDVVRL